MQGQRLFLPHLEISYIWQGLKFIENREKALAEIGSALSDIEKKVDGRGGEKKKGKESGKERVYVVDDWAMGHLFKVYFRIIF